METPTRAKLETSDLRDRALAAARKLHPQATQLNIESTRLMIYRSGLLKGVAGSNHLAYEAIIRGGAEDVIRDRIILAGSDPVGGQHAVGERDQREAQLVDLFTGGVDAPARRVDGRRWFYSKSHDHVLAG